MPENYENDNKQEQIGKNIDNLDRDINDLDNKVQERADFTKYFQDIQDIQNKFKVLDNDIGSITDEKMRKNLKDRMDNLKIMMLDLISDGSINNFINGETKDLAVNKMVGQVNEIFWQEMENLVKSLDLGNGNISEILSDATPLTEARLTEIAQFLNLPYGSLSIDGQQYLGFKFPPTGEIYALVDGKLKMCEGIFEEQVGGSTGVSQVPQQGKSGKSGLSISSSEKLTKASVDNPLQKKETVKLSYNVGNGFSAFASVDTQGFGATPRIGANWKGLNTKMGDIGLNSQLTASYSPGSITGSESGGRKDKDVFKLKAGETFKFKNGISLSLYETLKTSDFSKIKSSNLSTELRASWKPKSNISLSAIANFDYRGNPTFVGIGGNIRI